LVAAGIDVEFLARAVDAFLHDSRTLLDADDTSGRTRP
jgi:hypothetical protein